MNHYPKICKKVGSRVDDNNWVNFLALLSRVSDPSALDEILAILMTLEEKRAIGDRLGIIQALLAGRETHRQIAARLNVSIAKVTRGANFLKMVPHLNVSLFKETKQGKAV
ncbi:Trp operon repressor [invertebrate metagenome]|uniref:Trp operon repressor n=1 Tax=invertebrate metagenome TaxID=1711999 RepID=A0A2H9TCU2_9ZZZZ